MAAIPSLYNGAAGAATIPIRASAIPASYHWVTIGGVVAGDCVSYTKAFVRVYYATLAFEHITRYNAAGVNPIRVTPGNNATNVAARALIEAVPLIRKRALCVGAVRAGMMAMWNTGPQNLIANETYNTPILVLANGNIQTIVAHANNAMPLLQSLAYSMPDFTRDEEDVMHALFQMSMGVVPLAGLSILSTGHHYLSSNSAPTDAVMKQVLSVSSDPVKAWFAADSVEVKDAIWHKAAHPVTSNHLIGQALSREVAKRLTDSQMGSASVRLPFSEPEMKAARAMVAIVQNVQLPVTQVNGVLAVPALVAAIASVERFVVRQADVAPGTVADAPGILNRADAVTMLLIPAMTMSATAVGYALGVCTAMLDTLPARDRNSTLMNARSLTRLRQEQMPSVTAGAAFYDNLMKRDRTNAGNGLVVGPNMTI